MKPYNSASLLILLMVFSYVRTPAQDAKCSKVRTELTVRRPIISTLKIHAQTFGGQIRLSFMFGLKVLVLIETKCDFVSLIQLCFDDESFCQRTVR